VLKADRLQSSVRDVTKHSAHDRQNLEDHDDVQLVKFFSVLVVVVAIVVVIAVVVVIVFVVLSSSLIVAIVSICLISSTLMISFQMRMFILTFVLHVIITFAVSALLHLNDDQILDRKRKYRDDDCHDFDELDEDETIDANV
jgi:uncharacterized membrane protein YgaE (UPF0421/DUF939 family)